jgi:poly(hydroxyalkanoate) depolymerase family esterase
MRRISDTIARLGAAGQWAPRGGEDGGRGLGPLTDFGPNPGALAAWTHIPKSVAGMPLVVVLHGCTQSAAGYDRGAGWSELADRFGFALLFPEQSRSNNPNNCFNWFVPEDTKRGSGEAASVRTMIAAMIRLHPIDPARIFITGLSAGGAMTSVMLATYPDVFAGGAIIAGLPHAAANTLSQAFDRMRGHGHPSDDAYADAIRSASPHRGPWPTISVWHGSADATVSAANAGRIIGQWGTLQGLAESPDRETREGRHLHRVWHGADGRVQLEEHLIGDMGHGTPLATLGEERCGIPMPFMLDVGIPSTWQIARAWGLLGAEREDRSPVAATASMRPGPHNDLTPRPTTAASSIQDTIEAALRAAGLMR